MWCERSEGILELTGVKRIGERRFYRAVDVRKCGQNMPSLFIRTELATFLAVVYNHN